MKLFVKIPKWYVFSLFLFLFLFVFIFYLPVLTLIVLGFHLLLYLKLKQKVFKIKLIDQEENIFLSPCSGKVMEVSKNKVGAQYVTVKLSWFDHWGLYASHTFTQRETEYIKAGRLLGFKGLFTNRGDLETYDCYSMRGKIQNTSLFLNVYAFFVKPYFWMKSGDRAFSGACIGWTPLGGKVKLVLPHHIEFVITKGMKLKPLETVIAKLNKDS
jgi:hypothetical protein